MPKITVSAGGASYIHASEKFDSQRTINMYGERGTSGSADEWCWIGRPGCRLFGTITTGIGVGNRCLFKTASGRAFAVCGNTLSEFIEDGTETVRGTLVTTQGKVTMAENGQVIMIVDGTAGYFFDLTANTLTQCTDPDFFQNSSTVVYLDGYFIFNHVDNDVFGISILDANDPANFIDGYQVAVADRSPDNIVGLAVHGRNLFVFGEQSYQVFYNSGAVEFPIEPVQGAFFEIGCSNYESIAVGSNGVYWLGEDRIGHGVIYQTQGFAYREISTLPITAKINTYTIKDDAEGTVVNYNGHEFYTLGFINANQTFVYDSSTGLWAEWASNDNGDLNRFRGINCIYFAGKNVIGDTLTGNLYWLDAEYYQDHYDVLTRKRIFPHINQGGRWVRYNSMELHCENGVGLENGDTPYVMLRYSNDGGRQFYGELWRSLGKIGEYKTIPTWHQLGEARDRVFEITQTDPVKCYWFNFVIDADAFA